MTLVLTETTGSVGMLTLNNPDQLNAMAGTLIADALRALRAFEADGQVRAVVLTGAGRGFCSGASLAGDRLVASAGGTADRMRANLHP